MPYRIFVVEDHPVMRDAYARLLRREADFELCGTAESAEETLTLLDGLECDLVVADVSLPGMDGIALVERLRTLRPDLVALVVSAYKEDVYGQRAHAAGAHAYLNKKDLRDTLPVAIRAALAPSD